MLGEICTCHKALYPDTEKKLQTLGTLHGNGLELLVASARKHGHGRRCWSWFEHETHASGKRGFWSGSWETRSLPLVGGTGGSPRVFASAALVPPNSDTADPTSVSTDQPTVGPGLHSASHGTDASVVRDSGFLIPWVLQGGNKVSPELNPYICVRIHTVHDGRHAVELVLRRAGCICGILMERIHRSFCHV